MAPHGETEPINVPRFYCPHCPASFSLLPEGLLPICRFPLPLLCRIWEAFRQGVSAHFLFKSLGIRLGCLLRLRNRLDQWAERLSAWLRERDLPGDLPRSLPSLVQCLSSEGFHFRFSRAFYPKRFVEKQSHTIW